VVTQVPSGELTSVELSLVEHVCLGERLDLAASNEAVDEAAMRSWGESRTCRATVIRDILRGHLAADPDPHGLLLRGARITGRLDLANLTTDVNLELKDCLLEEGILARDAHLAGLSLTGCRLEHPAEPPLAADRLTCSVLDLSEAKITGHISAGTVRLRGGAVRLTGARIGGSLECDGASLHNDSGPALLADGLQVGQDIFFREGFTATGTGDDGAVRLTGAHVGGSVLCDGAAMRNDSGPGLVAYGLQVGQDVFLRRTFTATGAGERGAVRLVGAHIGGNLDCTGAAVRNDSGPALLADGLHVGQDMQCDHLTADGGVVLGGHIGRLLSFEGAALNNPRGFALLSDGLRVDGAMFCRNGFTAQGEVRLPGARIGGRLYFDGAKLSNPGGRALVASRLTVGQDMFCRKQGVPDQEEPFLAEGEVILTGAHVGGNLECTGAQLHNDSGPALYADSLQVDQAMLLNGGFTATGSGEDGAVRLSGAHIGGSLTFDGAILRNDSGPGLRAFRLQVDADMYLTGGFTATGSRDRGAVRLTGARIGGSLDCSGAELRNDSGPALLAYGIQVGQDIYLTRKFTAISGGEREGINLRTTRVGGAFDFQPERLEHTDDPRKRLRVDGLTYTGVPGPNSSPEPDSGPEPNSGERWRELLRHGTPAYTAQPYQQLAAGYRALGDDRQARRTLMAQRDDQLARSDTSWWERRWGRITKVTLGYGYQPWRALLFLAAVVGVSCVLAVVLGAHGALAQTSKTATPGRSCTVAQQVSVGLDLNLPVGTTVARVECDLTKDSASVTAAWLSTVGWVLRLLAWLFAALFIAGFTSAVRKT
jgi:hypothetical protein